MGDMSFFSIRASAGSVFAHVASLGLRIFHFSGLLDSRDVDFVGQAERPWLFQMPLCRTRTVFES